MWWKLVILGLAGYFLYKLLLNDFKKKSKEQERVEREETERMAQNGEMVKDPECGAYVAKEGAISVRDGDKVYYFCGYDCRDKFLKKLESGGRVLPDAAKKDDE